MRLLRSSDEFCFSDARLPGTDHHGRAVRIVRANVNAAVADQVLKSHPNIRLDVFNQMAEVDIAVGVGQGRGN